MLSGSYERFRERRVIFPNLPLPPSSSRLYLLLEEFFHVHATSGLSLICEFEVPFISFQFYHSAIHWCARCRLFGVKTTMTPIIPPLIIFCFWGNKTKSIRLRLIYFIYERSLGYFSHLFNNQNGCTERCLNGVCPAPALALMVFSTRSETDVGVCFERRIVADFCVFIYFELISVIVGGI